MGKKKKEENVVAEEESRKSPEEVLEDTEDNGAVTESSEADAASDDAVDYQSEALHNKDLYLRALADLENYRKRAQREKEDAIRYANSNLLREMIPVIDNLERAVEHANDGDDQDQGLLEGVQMTLEQFRKVLEGFGVKIIESLGQPFNPEFHQAMGEMVTSEHPPHAVAQEMQKAYTLNGRLLRPALVMIARAPEAETEEFDEGADDNEPDSTQENE